MFHEKLRVTAVKAKPAGADAYRVLSVECVFDNLITGSRSMFPAKSLYRLMA